MEEVMLGPFSLYAKCGDRNVTVFLFQRPTFPENGDELCQLRELVSSAASRPETEYRHPPALPFHHIGRGLTAEL